MNDSEIIKALECCGTARLRELHTGENPCSNCPMQDCEDCEVELPDCALDLIKRQQAEIERLKKIQQTQADRLIEERGQKYEQIEVISKLKKQLETAEQRHARNYKFCYSCGQALDWSGGK